MTVSMKQKRTTSTVWANSTYILGEGEIGVETNTAVIKIGDGVNLWRDLPIALSSAYLPVLGKAVDSDKLDGYDSSYFLPAASYVPFTSGPAWPASPVLGHRHLHTKYSSVATVPASGAGPNSYHAGTEFVWNGYSWRQTTLCTVESPADRKAMLAAVTAAGAAAACQPDAPSLILHDGFEIMETSGNRRYQWSGSAWMLILDANHSARYTQTEVVSLTGWSVTSVYLKQGPNGTVYLGNVSFSRTGAAITVPADGNIGNVDIGTLAAVWCPSQTVPMQAESTGFVATGYLGASGAIGLYSITGGGTIPTGTTFSLTAGYYPSVNPIALLDYVGA